MTHVIDDDLARKWADHLLRRIFHYDQTFDEAVERIAEVILRTYEYGQCSIRDEETSETKVSSGCACRSSCCSGAGTP